MVCIIHSSHAYWLHWTRDNRFLLRAVTELKRTCKAPWTPFTPSITESRWVWSTLHTCTDHTEHEAIDFFSEPSPDLKGRVRHPGTPSPLLYPCWAFLASHFNDLCSPCLPPMTQGAFPYRISNWTSLRSFYILVEHSWPCPLATFAPALVRLQWLKARFPTGPPLTGPFTPSIISSLSVLGLMLWWPLQPSSTSNDSRRVSLLDL